MEAVETPTDEVKALAFQIYLEQYPNINLQLIADQVGRHRSNISRYAELGQWAEVSKRIHARRQQESGGSDVAVLELEEILESGSFDELLDKLADKAVEYMTGGGFRFNSPNEVMRFLEMAEKHKDRRDREGPSESSSGLEDSSLPEQEEAATKAGMLLINQAARDATKVVEQE